MEWLGAFFGFQRDNVRNHREHLVLLLANAQMRLSSANFSDTLEPRIARQIRKKLLRNYTSWCGYCQRLKGQLQREGIMFSEVNIEEHPEAAAIVERVNGGNQTVPTLVYADGTAQTNPSVRQVQEKLAALA